AVGPIGRKITAGHRQFMRVIVVDAPAVLGSVVLGDLRRGKNPTPASVVVDAATVRRAVAGDHAARDDDRRIEAVVDPASNTVGMVVGNADVCQRQAPKVLDRAAVAGGVTPDESYLRD